VIFPTGVKVDIVRNPWGIDVTILTNRADSKVNESGICLYEDRDNRSMTIDEYGETQRYDLIKIKGSFELPHGIL